MKERPFTPNSPKKIQSILDGITQEPCIRCTQDCKDQYDPYDAFCNLWATERDQVTIVNKDSNV